MDLEKIRKVMDGRESIIEYNLINEDDLKPILAGLKLFRDLGADIDLEEAVRKLSRDIAEPVAFNFYGEQFEFTRYNSDDDMDLQGDYISVTRKVDDKNEGVSEEERK